MSPKPQNPKTPKPHEALFISRFYLINVGFWFYNRWPRSYKWAEQTSSVHVEQNVNQISRLYIKSYINLTNQQKWMKIGASKARLQPPLKRGSQAQPRQFQRTTISCRQLSSLHTMLAAQMCWMRQLIPIERWRKTKLHLSKRNQIYQMASKWLSLITKDKAHRLQHDKQCPRI